MSYSFLMLVMEAFNRLALSSLSEPLASDRRQVSPSLNQTGRGLGSIWVASVSRRDGEHRNRLPVRGGGAGELFVQNLLSCLFFCSIGRCSWILFNCSGLISLLLGSFVLRILEVEIDGVHTKLGQGNC